MVYHSEPEWPAWQGLSQRTGETCLTWSITVNRSDLLDRVHHSEPEWPAWQGLSQWTGETWSLSLIGWFTFSLPLLNSVPTGIRRCIIEDMHFDQLVSSDLTSVRCGWTELTGTMSIEEGMEIRCTVHSGWVLFAPTMGWYDFTSPWKEASAGCVWVGGFSRLIWAFHGTSDQFQINWHLDYRQIIDKKSQEKAHCREVPAVYSPSVGAARTVYCVRNSTASSRIMRALYPEWALLSLYELWIYLLTLRKTSREAHRDSIKRDKLFTVAHKLHDCFLPVCGQANWYYRSGLTSTKYL